MSKTNNYSNSYSKSNLDAESSAIDDNVTPVQSHIQAYCVNKACRQKVIMVNPIEVTKRNHSKITKMLRGTCPKGHTVCRILGSFKIDSSQG